MNIKQKILNTFLGNFLLDVRNICDLLKIYSKEKEALGTLINDHLGAFLVCKLCLKNKTFIDVGAHIGSIISQVHRNDQSVNIIGVEAIFDKAVMLEKKFPFIKVHHCAASDSNGEISFFINKNKTGYSSLIKPFKNFNEYKKILISQKRLDDLIHANDVDVIKIDVEGAELGVLTGSFNLINRCRPTIFFESAPDFDGKAGVKKIATWEYFQKINYIVLLPNRVAHEDDGMSLEGFLESHQYPRRTTNYFAVAAERRAEIRDRARFILDIKNSNQ
jgi:FkbM family methyltransferase